jgi:hypothetical protein
MKERDDGRRLCGVIQVDDAYWGGERHDDTAGRGSPNKVPFIAALACSAGRPCGRCPCRTGCWCWLRHVNNQVIISAVVYLLLATVISSG